MTIDEFLVQLEEIKDQFDWKKETMGIRGYNKKSFHKYCLLTGVHLVKNNRDLPTMLASKAGVELGLREFEVNTIICACDNIKSEITIGLHKRIVEILFGE